MPSRWLIAGIIVTSVLGGVVSISEENDRKGARTRRRTTDDPMLKGLSLDDRRAIPRVALVLYIDNAHLAHGTDGEMSEALFNHHQHAVEPAQPESGPSISAFDLERPPQEKKKKAKNTPNKNSINKHGDNRTGSRRSDRNRTELHRWPSI